MRLDATRQSLQLQVDHSIRRPVTGEFPFGRPRKLAKRGYRLRQVLWPDGSTAILDSRGLLHFKSSDNMLPEFSLVLHDEHVAGWSSDGRMWGLPYFIGDVPVSAAATVLDTVITPFLAQLQ